MGITQEEVLGKEGGDEGNETCARSDAISLPSEKLERKDLHRISAGKYITYMVSS